MQKNHLNQVKACNFNYEFIQKNNMSITRKHVEVFLITALAFAIFQNLSNGIISTSFSMFKTVLFSILFGTAMSFTLIRLHIQELYKMGIKNPTESHLRVRQKKNINTTISPQLLQDELKSNSNYSNIQYDQEENRLRVQTVGTWRSFGENISIHLKDERASMYEYELVSRPRWKSTLIDYGKNYKNILQLEQIIASAEQER